MTAVVGMALGKREIPKQLVLDSNTAADMFFKSADKVSVAQLINYKSRKCTSKCEIFLLGNRAFFILEISYLHTVCQCAYKLFCVTKSIVLESCYLEPCKAGPYS